MSILNIDGNNEDAPATKSARAKKIKVAKAVVGVGTIASLAGLGSTLAANISLNGGSNVEFGQGVAQTAACDADGFTITPVSYYDSDSSTFRLDYVEVSGLNLTPMGSNFESDPSMSYASQASAIAAHPGQYYDTGTNAWTNTCDQVVLDFKAYTDDVDYQTNTVDGYEALYNDDPLPNTVSSPLLWHVEGNGGVVGESASSAPFASYSDFAVIFDASNDNFSNFGTNQLSWDDAYQVDDMAHTRPQSYNEDSSFQFFAPFGHHDFAIQWNGSDYVDNVDPAVGPISKITVESMKYFPSNYVNSDQVHQFDQYGSSGFIDTWGDYGYYYLGSQYVPD